MSRIPDDCYYTKTHEWAKAEDDGITAVIGITDHAQQLMGDLVYVELPEIGRQVGAGEEIAVVESVKAASDIYSPVAGEVVAVNEELETSPETVNQQPFQDGWLFKVRMTDEAELTQLLDSSAYAEQLAEE